MQFPAAVKAQEKLGPEAVVVTIFCDDNKNISARP